MKWVTRKKVRVNRTATAWLIRRFIDPGATFLFVEAEQVSEVQRREGATGFDAPGATYPHIDDMRRCSFEALVDEYRSGDAALRALAQIVRGADFAWPIVGPYERQIQLQFVAANPVAVDPNTYAETIAFAGATGTSGRTYNRTFPQTYPLGGGSASTGIVESGGDLPVRPLLTIYGPVKQPTITFNRESDNATVGVIPFVSGYIIPAGSYVVVDTAAHTAYLNGNKAQPVLSSINWANLVWPVIPVLPDGANMIFTADPSGGVSTGATQCQANWWDSFLV